MDSNELLDIFGQQEDEKEHPVSSRQARETGFSRRNMLVVALGDIRPSNAYADKELTGIIRKDAQYKCMESHIKCAMWPYLPESEEAAYYFVSAFAQFSIKGILFLKNTRTATLSKTYKLP